MVIPLRNYAFDLILFVAGTFTASIPKAKPARPATNRKPVINVTGVKAGEVSAKLTLDEGDQFLIERIAGPAEEALGGHPQMRKVIHDLRRPHQHDREKGSDATGCDGRGAP